MKYCRRILKKTENITFFYILMKHQTTIYIHVVFDKWKENIFVSKKFPLGMDLLKVRANA